MKACIKFIVTIIILDSLRGSYSLKLYPFGSDAGDASLPIKDDATSNMTLTTPFLFFGRNFTALYVNENGIISFGSSARNHLPGTFPLPEQKCAAAPYWADVYTQHGGRVWYRVTSENVTVSRVTRDILGAFPHFTGFIATWVVIATWNEVPFYAAKDVYKQKRNTFQVLIASNGNMSFVGYLYDKLSWTTGTLNGGDERGLGGRPTVGFSYGLSYEIKVPGTILNLVNTSNCGRPGVWVFRVDQIENVDRKRCETKGNVLFYPKGGNIQSGANIFITGLCYRPGSELLCDFGEAGTVKGYTFGETKAVCSVPFITTKKEVEFSVYPTGVDKFNFAEVFILEPVHLYNTSVKLRGNSTSWISRRRVDISWNPKELTNDHTVIVEIINLVDVRGTIQVHSNITAVMEQPNTGKAEFNLPALTNMSKDFKEPKQLHMIRVQSIQKNGYSKYVAKQWVMSGLFLSTNHLLAHNSCSEWLHRKSESLSHRKSYQALTFCPKTERQVKADIGRFAACDLCDIQNMPLCEMHFSRVNSCYVTRTLSNLGLGRRCYYDNKGELTPGPPSVITNQTLEADASEFLFFWEEILPYQECCIFSDNCLKYQDLGIFGNEARYIPPNIGASFGDPHIITLDNVEYTFNGFGEYTVLDVNNTEFILQGRMQPLNGRQTGKTSATVFTAFAMRQKGGSSIQVQREDIDLMMLLVDGKRVTIDFGQELQFTGVFIRNTSRERYSRVVLAFTSGITVYVENAAVLQLAVSVPVEFKGKTSGLLGYWNDNSDEEYLLPNRQFPSPGSTMTMAEIHHNFGQKWATTLNDSLFTYGPGKQHADYFDSSYVPTFMEGFDPIIAKLNDGIRKRALATCEHSFQCVFDIAVTGREEIGQATKEFQEWLHNMKRDLHDEGCSAVLLLEEGSVQTKVAGDLTSHHFECNDGYVIFGKDKISCRAGVWDGSKPKCYRAAPIACKPLSILILNGQFYGQGNQLGDRYTFECDSPFTLIGNSEVVCGKDGLWSGQVPFCQRRQCSQVTVNNSQVLLGNDGQRFVRCNKGYTLIGASKIRCLNNGLLNGTLPSCVREQSRTAPIRQTNIIPVVIIGVVVVVIATIIVLVTTYLVRRHHRRKPKENPEEVTV